MKCKPCELCNQQASLYCPSDSAFLCRNCDHSVHRANFLVARHLRHTLCSNCNRFTGIHISGITLHRLPSSCRSCSPENRLNDANSQSSSSSESKKTKNFSSSVTDDASKSSATAEKNEKKIGSESVGSVAEELFVRWRRELGLEFPVNGNCVAVEALSLCLRTWKLLPLKVAATASFWLGLQFCGEGYFATCHNLMKLEKISKVPAKHILVSHAKLARVFTQSLELKEGCDES